MTELLLARGAGRTAPWRPSGNAEWLRARHAEGTLGQPIFGDEGLLSLAVRYDRPEMLALLLDLGFDPDERRQVDLEPPEYTWGQPLRHCAEFGKPEMAKLLLARGADPNAHIWAGGTPVYAAYRQKDQAIIDLLESHGAYLDAECVGDLGLAEKARQMLDDKPRGGSGRESCRIRLRRCLWRKYFWYMERANRRFCRWHWSGLIAGAAIRGGFNSYRMPGVIWAACAQCLISAIPTSADHCRTILHDVAADGAVPKTARASDHAPGCRRETRCA